MAQQDSHVSAIVASLDLQLVRLLRDAIRTANCASHLGRACGHSNIAIAPRKRIEPEPEILPRKRIEPAPRFEPRPVIYVRPPAPPCPPPPCPAVPECTATKGASVLPPPWKSLPPVEHPARTAPKVKVHIQRPDIVTKGSLIDFFM